MLCEGFFCPGKEAAMWCIAIIFLAMVIVFLTMAVICTTMVYVSSTIEYG